MHKSELLKSYFLLLKNFYFNKSHSQGPESIDLAITSVCNHRCYFCDEHSYFIEDREKNKSQTLDELTLDALFDDLVKLKVKKITLGGNGEQLMIPLTSKYILRYGHIFKFQVSSNGTTLNKINEEMLSKIDRFSISINSFDDATHQKIHGYNLNNSNSQLPKIIENTERI
jgi:MoaA/NifB/PqqE/SkfB family radical SAM enzyme